MTFDTRSGMNISCGKEKCELIEKQTRYYNDAGAIQRKSIFTPNMSASPFTKKNLLNIYLCAVAKSGQPNHLKGPTKAITSHIEFDPNALTFSSRSSRCRPSFRNRARSRLASLPTVSRRKRTAQSSRPLLAVPLIFSSRFPISNALEHQALSPRPLQWHSHSLVSAHYDWPVLPGLRAAVLSLDTLSCWIRVIDWRLIRKYQKSCISGIGR